MMGDTAKPKPREHRCQWCPKLARSGSETSRSIGASGVRRLAALGRRSSARSARGGSARPSSRDCMPEAHEVYRAKRKGNTDPQGFTGR